MNDSRFNPVSKHEISQLSVSVSLLVGFEDGTDYLDWTVCLLCICCLFCMHCIVLYRILMMIPNLRFQVQQMNRHKGNYSCDFA